MSKVNLKYLAERLNLSISTVSKAFRNSYDISPETRQKILALARELDFEPNHLASSLRTQKTNTIAVIIPEIANTFFTQVINGIESIAQTKGYHVLIYITHEESEKEIDFIKSLQHGRVDGVLISLSNAKSFPLLSDLQKKNFPIVFFDRIYNENSIIKVTTNDFESSYIATKHLIENKCKKIAHLTISKNLSIAENRKDGYIQALKDYELPFDRTLLIDCTNNELQNKISIKQLLTKIKPDGIFSAFEKLAMLTYDCCAELNINIPKELKIISFSNLEIASLLNPSLSTITQPAFEIGEQAAKLLFQRISPQNKKEVENHIVINSVLHNRISTSNQISYL